MGRGTVNALAERLDIERTSQTAPQYAAYSTGAFTELQRIDIVVSNAGYALSGAAEEVSDAQIERQLNALYFKTTGKPLDVLLFEKVAIPTPGAGQVRVRVQACALNPDDWAVCEGFLSVPPPKGINA